MSKSKIIVVWKIWNRNWENAKQFFNSSGNTKTRSRLKDKWYKDFKKDIFDELFKFTEVREKENLSRLK